jgi:hypothetical protein
MDSREPEWLTYALKAHVDTLKADVEQLKVQLSVEARAGHEMAWAERAISGFSALADRLAALAEERARPWWRRIRRSG